MTRRAQPPPPPKSRDSAPKTAIPLPKIVTAAHQHPLGGGSMRAQRLIPLPVAPDLGAMPSLAAEGATRHPAQPARVGMPVVPPRAQPCHARLLDTRAQNEPRPAVPRPKDACVVAPPPSPLTPSLAISRPSPAQNEPRPCNRLQPSATRCNQHQKCKTNPSANLSHPSPPLPHVCQISKRTHRAVTPAHPSLPPWCILPPASRNPAQHRATNPTFPLAGAKRTHRPPATKCLALSPS
jgi:hypothetical protein